MTDVVQIEGFRAYREIEDVEGIAKVQQAFCDAFFRVASPIELPNQDTADAALQIEVFSKATITEMMRDIGRKAAWQVTQSRFAFENVVVDVGHKRRFPVTEHLDKFTVGEPIDNTGTRVVSLTLPYAQALNDDRSHIYSYLNGRWKLELFDGPIVGLKFPIAKLHDKASITEVVESKALWPADVPLSPLQLEA